MVSTSVLDYIELSPDFSIVEIEPIPEWHDKTLGQLDIREKYGLNIMAIKRNEDVIISPKAKDYIFKGDILFVVGENKDIEKLEKRF